MNSKETMTTTQYLTFGLGKEEFALEIIRVREVLDYTTITKVPRMPEFLRGVINLRGNVVPVIDLRLKLGMFAAERTKDTCIVIVEIQMDGEQMQLGCLTDSVQEVIDLDPSQIEPAPRIGTKLNTEFIQGMGKKDDKFLIILDIDRVLSSGELAVVQSSGGSQNQDLEKPVREPETPPLNAGTSFATTQVEPVQPTL
jgi:purine-binding chemotaxis protein CheW